MIQLSRTFIPATLGAALALTATIGVAHSRVPHTQDHQFQQALLPTDTPGLYKLGIWVFNRANGRIRLCVLNEDGEANAPVMKCSPWMGSGPAGQYYLMQIRRHPRQPGHFRAGLWILNRETGHARACVITDINDPTGTLRCSKVQ